MKHVLLLALLCFGLLFSSRVLSQENLSKSSENTLTNSKPLSEEEKAKAEMAMQEQKAFESVCNEIVELHVQLHDLGVQQIPNYPAEISMKSLQSYKAELEKLKKSNLK